MPRLPFTLLAVLCCALLAAAARADDPIRYQLPDGTVGFAQDSSSLPPDAKILKPPTTPGGQIIQRDATDHAPRRTRNRPRGFDPDQDLTPEERYSLWLRELREQTEKAKKKADAIPCEDRWSRSGNARAPSLADCSARNTAQQQAEQLAKENEQKRRELLRRCREEDDCEPALLHE